VGLHRAGYLLGTPDIGKLFERLIEVPKQVPGLVAPPLSYDLNIKFSPVTAEAAAAALVRDTIISST
jgi:hypothetical protein